MIEVTVSNAKQTTRSQHIDGPVELGRGPRKGLNRIVIDDRYVSRDQLRLEEVSESEIWVENLGSTITLTDGAELEHGGSCSLTLPARLTAGYSMISVSPVRPEHDELLGMQTVSPSLLSLTGGQQNSQTLSDLGESPSPAELANWFESLLTVQRSVPGSSEFYEETARAIVELVSLDHGLVLLRHEDDWEVAARYSKRESRGHDVHFSRSVLSQVVSQRRTFFRGIKQQERMQSLAGIETVVASPIFDDSGKVSGVVYGSRDMGTEQAHGIRPLEAQMVQLLAGAVSAGLARLQIEAQAARTRVQFEEFFSSELVCELERNPGLLSGHDREITVLFCDLRSFSRISEKLGARQIYELLGDVMDRFTERVMEHNGVIIDYHGDGLAAMWNAPKDNALHAKQACAAGEALLSELPALNQRWASSVGFPLGIGIGINSGLALVGNAGSSRRMKYGPLGHTVNLASRVEGATKHFGVPLLITGLTRDLLGEDPPTRRICRVRVVGIDQAVPLYEYRAGGVDADWLAHRDLYEQALSSYESSQFERSLDLLDSLPSESPFASEVPCQMLARKAAQMAKQCSASFDPVFELSSK